VDQQHHPRDVPETPGPGQMPFMSFDWNEALVSNRHSHRQTNVAYWHEADITVASCNVAFVGNSRHSEKLR
jgi:hypothetical protein